MPADSHVLKILVHLHIEMKRLERILSYSNFFSSLEFCEPNYEAVYFKFTSAIMWKTHGIKRILIK
jgi:hypothetical protein